ncbi:MAG TPA: hypothetical protein VK909_09370 [Anaerolineales bacterium]|nr:hypothetical protein [Anaerolineales bacterium]
MLAPITHVLPLTTIVRERLLPVPGKVNVHVNQRVNPTDVIAEATFAREHVLLDVARIFGISPAAADKLIRVQEGEKLTEGAVVAESTGLFARSVKAPRPGRVMIVGSGQVLMEVGDTRVELRAGLPGLVSQVIPDRGVVIRTAGALVQGVWGNGRIDNGLMVNLLEKPDDVLSAGRLDVSLRGSVILGGQIRDVETLKAAAELPVRGLILSSMPSSLLQTAYQMRFPMMVTEGFGAIPMNSAAFKLLTTNNKREATVNAEHFDRYTGSRPEVIIPLPISNEPEEPRQYEPFAAGQQVRMRRPPNAGMIGTISNLPSGLSLLPSGLRASAAEVKLENGENVIVPLVNLELVG